MNLSRISGTILTLLFLTLKASASPETLVTLSSNYPLNDNGGGTSALLNGVSVELFCDDFAHQIWAPYSGYTANVSTLTNGSDLSLTRFGTVTSWTTVNVAADAVAGGDATNANDATYSSVINNANALARYQMAAYLVTLYQPSQGPANNPYNNGIQEAIWTLMDPTPYWGLPSAGDATTALRSAAQWYSDPGSDKSFLSQFEIISDTQMYGCGVGAAQCGGFQEQLYMAAGTTNHDTPTVPEPRAQLLVILALLGFYAFRYHSRRKTT